MMLLQFTIFGTFLEGYESMFSNFVNGNFNIQVETIFQTSNHFIILRGYQILQKFFPDYNVYAYIILLYNILSLLLCSLVLYRILWVNLQFKSLFLYVILVYFLINDSFININSARNAIFLFIGCIALVESQNFERKYRRIGMKILILFGIVYSVFIRFEMVLLFSLLYFVYSIALKRILFYAYFSLATSVIIFCFHVLISKHCTSNDERIFMKYEKKIIDKGSIDFQHLTAKDKVYVEAFLYRDIIDRIHFQENFYTDIFKKDTTIMDKLKEFVKEYIFTIKTSRNESKSSDLLIICFIASMVSVLFIIKNQNNKLLSLELILLFFPMILYVFTMVPSRFLSPYFTICLIINLLFLVAYNFKSLRYLIVFFSILFIYRNFEDSKFYKNAIAKNKVLVEAFSAIESKPFVIFTISENIFSPYPFSKVKKQEAYFLNLFLFTGWDFYKKPWRKFCNCEPISLLSKLEFLSNENITLLMNNEQCTELIKYVKLIYNKKIIVEKKEQFSTYDSYTIRLQ